MTSPPYTFRVPPFVSLLAAVASLFFALVFLVVTVRGGYTFAFMMLTAFPAIVLSLGGLLLGLATLKKRPPGKAYGFAMGGSLLGGFGLVFWLVLFPLMFVIMLPHMQLEPEEPALARSEKQMRVIIRQIKTFYAEEGRVPANIEELVEKNYIRLELMYDPRVPLRDAPGYRIMLREMPPMDLWAQTPALEGRWPDPEGRRLIGFLDEHIELHDFERSPPRPAN